MRILEFDGIAFSTLQVQAKIERALPGEDRTPQFLTRRGSSPLPNGVQAGSRPIPLYFYGLDGDAEDVIEGKMLTLLATIDPNDTERLRTIVCEINPAPTYAPVSVQAEVLVGKWDWLPEAKGIKLTLYAADALFEKLTDTTVGPETIDAGSPTMAITNPGNVDSYAVIERSAPTSTFSATVTTRRRVAITNNGVLPIERETMGVGIAYSTLFGFAPRMVKNGIYYPVTAMSTAGVPGATCYYWFPATIDAGDTESFDLINTIGANPNYDLDTPTRFDGNYSAIDLGYLFVTNATAAGASTITDGALTETVNRWKGGSIFIYGGTGAGQAREIASNTATQFTVTRAWSTTPDTTSDFMLIAGGVYLDGGSVTSATSSSITDSAQTWLAKTLIGGTVSIYAGTGSGQSAEITDNTATAITIDGTWGVTPDSTSRYKVERFGYHRYYTDRVKHGESHRGGYQQNKRYTPPTKFLWGDDILNGWGLFQYLDNADDFNQLTTTPVNLGGSDVDYFPILNASRYRGADRKIQQEGQFDGLDIYHGWGYDVIEWEWDILNQNSASGASAGIGKAVLAVREPGGDDFAMVVEDSTLRSTIATAIGLQTQNLIDYGSPTQLYMGMLPADGVAVSNDAKTSDQAQVLWGNTLRLWVSIADKYSQSIGAEETVIPIEDEIRIGSYSLQIGMRDGQRLYATTTEKLVIDCANARAWLDDSGTITDVTYAVHPLVYKDLDGDGVEEAYMADRWLPIPKGSSTLTASGAPWASAGAFTLSLAFPEQVYV